MRSISCCIRINVKYFLSNIFRNCRAEIIITQTIKTLIKNTFIKIYNVIFSFTTQNIRK